MFSLVEENEIKNKNTKPSLFFDLWVEVSLKFCTREKKKIKIREFFI